ncbi:MAG: iron complex outermembrane receptor protein [Alteromonadaceae bacterium]|jgi:iron complex outermembrane receptor protein
MHYNERNGFDTEDTISEYRADFTWVPDSDNAFYKMDFGIYYQDREKDNTRRFASACNVYCGYSFDIPDELLTVFTAENYFAGVPNQWLTYNPEAFFDYANSDAAAQQIADATGLSFDDVRATLDATNISNPQASADSYVVGEELLSVYTQFYFQTEISDLPLDINFGFRYTETDTSVDGTVQQVQDLEPIPNDPSDLNVVYATDVGTPINEKNSYSSLLPNVNVKLQLTDDLYLRYAYSETLTRPMMDDLVPVFNVTVSRPGNLQAQAGNTELQPYQASSWDVSLEWYYDDTSYFSAAAFNKEVEDFISSSTEEESLFLDSGEYVFSVLRPRNGETLNVEGLELAWLHTLENGFGIQANATIVNSDAEFSLPGLGNSQNITLFYEKDAFQARVALNNRETFMQEAVSSLGGTEPLFTETYTQVDMSVSYDVNETVTVFFEGINITEEELTRRGRLSEHFVQQVNDGARYAVGVRANF